MLLRSIVACLALLAFVPASPPRAVLLQTPFHGIQPPAVVAADGVLHVIYFSGDPAHGDLYYVQRGRDGTDFSTPIRVNSESASVLAVGSNRGGQLALGRDGWVHVAWHSTPSVKDGM